MVDEFDHQPMRQLVRRLLVEESYDVLQCEYLLMAPYAPTGTTRFARVLTEHQVHFAARAREIPYAPWWRKPWGSASVAKGLATETALCERFDVVVTMSELDRRALQWWLPRQRIEAIPLGADLEHFRPQPETQPRWDVVFLGYFRHSPNVDAVLWCAREIWPLIRRARPSATWVIVGYDPPPEIAALGQQPGITVAGSVEDVRSYLAQSRLFVMPIRLGRGLRVKLAEAWAMGLPVVTTTVGCEGYPVIAGDDLVIADRPEAFAKTVVGLLNDPERARRIGVAGRRRAETVCSWGRIGRQTEALYLELLGMGKGNAYNERPVEVAEADRQELVSLSA
jgi:glycosyltransferase involved in cell wall biosynthesis